MKILERASAAGAAALLCLSLAACSEDKRPTPADLSLVTQRLDEELNAPAKSLRDNLVRALADKKIFDPELVVTGEGDPTPVDWWVYDRGLIRLAGVEADLGYFELTDKGQALAAEKRPQWLVGVVQGEPQVSCAGGGSWTSCQITAVAQVKTTPEGATYLGAASFPDVGYKASLVYGPSGWRVADFQSTSTSELSEASRHWIFGDDASISKARYKFALKVNRLVK